MTTARVETSPPISRGAQIIGAEIRAALAREGWRQRRLAEAMHVHASWLSRRISPTADIEMTVDDLLKMTEALGVSAERFLSPLLPRLDSNQQPSGYPSPQVSGPVSTPRAPVVPIGAARGGARVNGLPRSRPVPSGAPRALRAVV